MDINRFLVHPAVDKQDRFRIVQRLAVLLPQVSGFRPDGGHGAAAVHFFSELPGISVFAGVSYIHSHCHAFRLLPVSKNPGLRPEPAITL